MGTGSTGEADRFPDSLFASFASEKADLPA
jgi:hypothetical protein